MILSATDLAAIAKVSIAGVVKGTAFLVAPRYAITANHVVRGATAAVDLTFAAGSCTAKVIANAGSSLDWALLELDAPIAAAGLRLAAFDRWHDDAWASHGYGLYAAGNSGGPIKGDFFSETPQKLEMRCTEVEAAADIEGYSGAPLITSSGTVGVIWYTRADATGAVKGGYFAAVTTRAILEDWPASHLHVKPVLRRAPYVQVLCASLEQIVGNRALRETLYKAVQLAPVDPAVAAERIAERLVELPWREIRDLIDRLGGYATADLKDLLCSMWVRRQAATQLAGMVDRSAVPVIKTEAPISVRHHVMRAQGELDLDSLINWRDRKERMFHATDNGEALEVQVEKTLGASLLSTDLADLKDHTESFDPVFVSVRKIPTAAEVAAVHRVFGPNVRLIGYAKAVTTPMLATNPTAELVEPTPDGVVERDAKLRTPKEFW
jgi:hypothetical protein